LAASRLQYFAIVGFDVKAFQNFAWNWQDSSQVSRDDKRILFAVSRWGWLSTAAEAREADVQSLSSCFSLYARP
jgi:hypothetical protein